MDSTLSGKSLALNLVAGPSQPLVIHAAVVHAVTARTCTWRVVGATEVGALRHARVRERGGWLVPPGNPITTRYSTVAIVQSWYCTVPS